MNPTPYIGQMPARAGPGDDRPGAENTGRGPRNLAIYAAALAVLWLLVLVLPETASVTATVVAMAAGAGTLAAAIVRWRPVGRAGWWLVAASSVGLVAAVVIDRYGMEDGGVVGPPAQVLVALSLLALAGGLALLGRRQPAAAGAADVLDAVVIVAGSVLLVWMFVGERALSEARLVVSVALPVSAVLVGAAIVKLVLGSGLCVPAIALLVASSAALLAGSADVILPAVSLTDPLSGRPTRIFWATHGGLLGAAALHPSFARAVRRLGLGATDPGASGTDLSPTRLVLSALAAALVPVAIVLGLLDKPAGVDRSLAGIAVPASAATAVLLGLVGRLALITRVSQRRAQELARRSAALTEAMTRQEALRQELAFRAMHDPLTGLDNRVVLAERLEWALGRQAGPAGPDGPAGPGTGLLLIDLDGFKDINDTYGHPVGDEVLASVGRRLRGAVPADAVVARLGGDEFAILVDATTSVASARQAERVLAVLRDPFLVEGRELYLSASIGMLETDRGAHSTASAALGDADLALYAAKSAGRNRIVTFEPRLRAERAERVRISVGLRRALSRGELTLEYQPIVGLFTDGVLAVEALVRWQPPGSEPIPPAEFLPVAEATGLINAVGSRVLRLAGRDAARWYAEQGVAVSVNVSGRQLADNMFVEIVGDALGDAGLPPAGLILELSEDALIAAVGDHAGASRLRELCDRGVRVAVDGFGGGYASMAHLAKLPVDIVKLEKSFARGSAAAVAGGPGVASPGAADWAFTGAVLEAVAGAGLSAVAEGVETAEQVEALRGLRCGFAQGRFFAGPMPAQEMDVHLRARRERLDSERAAGK